MSKTIITDRHLASFYQKRFKLCRTQAFNLYGAPTSGGDLRYTLEDVNKHGAYVLREERYNKPSLINAAEPKFSDNDLVRIYSSAGFVLAIEEVDTIKARSFEDKDYYKRYIELLKDAELRSSKRTFFAPGLKIKFRLNISPYSISKSYSNGSICLNITDGVGEVSYVVISPNYKCLLNYFLSHLHFIEQTMIINGVNKSELLEWISSIDEATAKKICLSYLSTTELTNGFVVTVFYSNSSNVLEHMQNEYKNAMFIKGRGDLIWFNPLNPGCYYPNTPNLICDVIREDKILPPFILMDTYPYEGYEYIIIQKRKKNKIELSLLGNVSIVNINSLINSQSTMIMTSCHSVLKQFNDFMPKRFWTIDKNLIDWGFQKFNKILKEKHPNSTFAVIKPGNNSNNNIDRYICYANTAGINTNALRGKVISELLSEKYK